jgi:uncharacterized protein (TIGR02145 family)
MKKILILFAAILLAMVANAQEKTMYVMSDGEISYSMPISAIDSIVFYEPNVAVKSISLNKVSLELLVSESETLQATVLPVMATDPSITWTSSDKSVATVDDSGTVTALSGGTATITATAGEQQAECLLTVKTVASVSLDKATLNLISGKTATLTATVLPATVTEAVAWSSSNTAVATVDNTGKVTAIKEGTATITAKVSDKQAVCTITVSGVKIGSTVWATCNVDAPGTFAANPQSAGKFYQWNRKIAWSATGSVTGWDASTPSGTSWTSANDPCPEGWRVPNSAEIDALLANTTNSWTTSYNGTGIAGRIFTSGTNSLFFPAAGYRDGSSSALYFAGTYGRYWSSAQYDSTNAYNLYFGSSNAGRNYYYRADGQSVRCVAE